MVLRVFVKPLVSHPTALQTSGDATIPPFARREPVCIPGIASFQGRVLDPLIPITVDAPH